MHNRTGTVARHRASRLRPSRLRLLTLTGCVLALAAPVYSGAATLTGRSVDRAAGTSTWIVPNHVDDVPLESADLSTPPNRLRIASLGVDTGLEDLTVDAAGQLRSPEDYGEAGWFAAGTVPGEPGPAVFFKLHQLKTGDRIEVRRGERWLSFTVTAKEHYPKAKFPSQRVYGPTPVPELRLITCGGEFDAARHSYRDNIVVYAVLT